MEVVSKKSNKVKDGFTKVKTKVNSGFNKAKTSVSNWNQAIKKAYAAGYNVGYNSHRDIPNRFGTRHAATRGFSTGLRNARQHDKYTKK